MIAISISLAIILSTFFYFLKIIRRYRRYDKLLTLPYKPPTIFFGNTIDFLGSTTKFLTNLFLYHETYGEIVKVYDGPLSVGVISGDQKLNEFILNSTKLIDKADQYDYLKNWLGTGLLTSTGKKWKTRRRILTPSFHFSILEQFISIFESVGNVLIEKFEKEVGKKSVDIYPFITLCTLDIICEAAMGTSVDAQNNSDSEYVRSVKNLCAIVIERTFSPLPRFLYPLSPNFYKEKKALNVLHSYTDDVINTRINEKEKQTQKNHDLENFGIVKRKAFLDMLLECTVDGQPLSRSDLREEVDTFMFEGHDTTASAISFALYSLATNPSVQEKAFQEQQEIFGNDLKNVKATASDLNSMKYLELVLKETLRLYPSVPMLGRVLSEDVIFDGVTYPKGINVMLLIFRSHRNPNYFKDPEKFIPERFSNSEDHKLFSYIPFSAGSRNCIGQRFAMLEMKSTVSKVLRNFELLPASPVHHLELAPETILLSKNGIKISLKKRK